jgi:hypothetical protein
MSSYTVFSTSRTSAPDPAALLVALRAVEASAGYAQINGAYRVKTTTVLTPSQRAAMQAAIDTVPEFTPQRFAQNQIDEWPLAMKALVLTLIDQLNMLRTRVSPPLTAITPAQALTAIRDKAATL